MPNQVDIHRNKMSAPILVNAEPSLTRLAQRLLALPLVAVDTESDSLFSYFEKTCLIQFSTPATDYLVDPLAFDDRAAAMQPLAPLFADPHSEKIFHAAEYDIYCMKRDFHFQFANLFDTMIAARILGWKNIGLGNVLNERFGVTLNKKMQRADWGHRPLTQEQIDYAREDTHYLLALRDVQIAELEKLGRLTEAREEFARLAKVEPTPRRFDPDAYWHIDGARKLNPRQLGVLRELYHLRDAQARKEDKPPFKILSDATLMHIATELPTSPRLLTRLNGISEFVSRRYGTSILAAVARGEQSPQNVPPRPHIREDAPFDDAARNRLGKLKEWRKARAAERGVETDVIVSNEVLITVARKNPKTLDALIEASGLGPWKSEQYGEEMLNVLRGKKK